MIITLAKADFSMNNIGTINSFSVICNMGLGCNYNGPISIERNESYSATVSCSPNYAIETIHVYMGDSEIFDYAIENNNVLINISNVTGIIRIVATAIVNIVKTITSFEGFETAQGFISSTNTWNNISDKYKITIVPVNAPTTLEMIGGEETIMYFAGLRSYSAPVNGATPDFSTAPDWTGRLTLNKGASKFYNVPDDVKYLIFCTYQNYKDVILQNLKIVTSGGGQ